MFAIIAGSGFTNVTNSFVTYITFLIKPFVTDIIALSNFSHLFVGLANVLRNWFSLSDWKGRASCKHDLQSQMELKFSAKKSNLTESINEHLKWYQLSHLSQQIDF